jgi:hypothetical protein
MTAARLTGGDVTLAARQLFQVQCTEIEFYERTTVRLAYAKLVEVHANYETGNYKMIFDLNQTQEWYNWGDPFLPAHFREL